MRISGKVMTAGAITLLAAAVISVKVFKPVEVVYVSPLERRLVQEVFGTGTVEARVLVTAGSKVTGRVVKLYADQGDFVKKGQILARLEGGDLQALVSLADDNLRKSVSMETATDSDLARARAATRAADAALQKSDASLKLARQTFERYEALYGKGAVSRQDLDEKQAALDEAARQRENLEAVKAAAGADAERVRNTLEAARHETGAGTASSAYARARLEDTVVRASMDGVVVSRDAEEGDAVVPGSPIFRIADPATVWVKANVDEAQAGGVAPGNAATVYLRSGGKTPIEGRVARVAQESDRVTEETEVDVAFPLEDKARLHLGERADVYIKGAESDGYVIPAKAVTLRDGKAGVFVDRDGRAVFVPVRTGIWTPDYVGIEDGLDGSDRVFLLADRLQERLKDGTRVKSRPSAEAN
ncbi:MAG: efflux RND transporter periplasmic adaptor subunit [Nitrospirae bacterium]|nr:efflux RND transporter periplasmic adaptor subunit [Nitrospirota bacterium]